MTVIHLRPVGWGDMTPNQWRAVREMIQAVSNYAWDHSTKKLWLRAERFLANTAGRDV